MKSTILFSSAILFSHSLASLLDPTFFNTTGIVCRFTKPAASVLNEQTAQMIQTSFRHADYPDIKGERSMHPFGKVDYGLTNISVDHLSIENSDVDFREDDAIDLDIQNVSASFRGTLTYGFVGNWFARMTVIHTIDFEIESAIDLQLSIKLDSEKERISADTSDCYLYFHKLDLHLQGDKDPGWLKHLFTNFLSFTLKLMLKSQVCKKINFLSNLLADFIQDTAANFVQDGDVGLDISLAAYPVIKANYVESHHKGLLLGKNHSSMVPNRVFTPSLLTESRMLYFWISEEVLSSLLLATFLDDRLELTIPGEELKEMLESEKLKIHQEAIQKIFQSAPYGDSMAKVWSLDAPQVALQPEGTVVKATVVVELSASLQGEEPSTFLYFEADLTITVQTSYAHKKLGLHPSHATINPRIIKSSPNMTTDHKTLVYVLKDVVSIAGIPKVISRIELALTAGINCRGVNSFEIRNAEIITKEGYFFIQMDLSIPHHLLIDFLKKNLGGPSQEDKNSGEL